MMTALVSPSPFITAVTAFNTFHNFLSDNHGAKGAAIDPADVVDLDKLFPEEDFPYHSDFAFPFMFNSLEEEEPVEAEHREYSAGIHCCPNRGVLLSTKFIFIKNY